MGQQGWSDLYPQMMLKVADDLEALVRIWVGVLDLVRPAYPPGQVIFEFDSSRVPVDLIEQHVVSK